MQERVLNSFFVCTLNAGTHIAGEFFADTLIIHGSQMVVSHIHKRIPLIMAGAVGAHPRSDRLAASVFEGLRQIFGITGSFVQLHGSEFHVVYPVVFFVDVG